MRSPSHPELAFILIPLPADEVPIDCGRLKVEHKDGHYGECVIGRRFSTTS